jgi:sortase A
MFASGSDGEEQGLMWTLKKPLERQVESSSGNGNAPKRGRNVWIWTERLLLASGVLLVAVYAAVQIDSFLSSRTELRKFAALESTGATSQDDAEEQTLPSEMESPDVDFRLWDQPRVQAYRDSLAAQSGAPLGVLRISKIHLEAPVLDGTDDVTLNRGVGRIRGTARPGESGNIGIAGHRDGFFRGLKDVAAGDAIELKTLKGTDTYVVDRIQIVMPNNVDVLRPGQVPSVTLVTCYPFYFFGSAPKRYIVTASLSREIKRGSENSVLSPLSATSSSTRRNYEQSE